MFVQVGQCQQPHSCCPHDHEEILERTKDANRQQQKPPPPVHAVSFKLSLTPATCPYFLWFLICFVTESQLKDGYLEITCGMRQSCNSCGCPPPPFSQWNWHKEETAIFIIAPPLLLLRDVENVWILFFFFFPFHVCVRLLWRVRVDLIFIDWPSQTPMTLPLARFNDHYTPDDQSNEMESQHKRRRFRRKDNGEFCGNEGKKSMRGSTQKVKEKERMVNVKFNI